MSQEQSAKERLQARLEPILELLRKQQLESAVVRNRETANSDVVERLLERQQLGVLSRKIAQLRDAEIAHLLEMLPPQDRGLVWGQVPTGVAGEVLWELSEAVATHLVEQTSEERLLAIANAMDADAFTYITDLMPNTVIERRSLGAEPGAKRIIESAVSFAEDSVGYLMSNVVLTISQAATVKDALKAIRNHDELPEQFDTLFVVDVRGRLVGVLPVMVILRSRLREPIEKVMTRDFVSFSPADTASSAATAFERFDLLSAPVTDAASRVIGRLSVDIVMDFVREAAEEDALQREGLRGDEDLFGPIARGARRRWLWLGVNLTTAFIASRVIGVFEHTIEQLVIVATLMPIVASIGGNTGNQTVALVVRGLALDQVRPDNLRYMTFKELGISVVNGLLWGSVLGILVYFLYADLGLGLVLAGATLLNLIVSALAGVVVPLALHRAGRDPAMGSSVLLTFITDSMGFFIFLALATLFLLGR